MEKRIILLTPLIILFFNAYSLGITIQLNDGQSHIIANTIHQNNYIDLDWHNNITPGTSLNIVTGALIYTVHAYYNSSIAMSGGRITNIHGSGNATIRVSGGSIEGGLYLSNTETTISGGTIGVLVHSTGNSAVAISGGSCGAFRTYNNAVGSVTGGHIESYIKTTDNSVITVSGGTLEGYLGASNNGVIYLAGTNFEVDGQMLSCGDRLSSFVPLTEHIVDDRIEIWRTGTVTGVLADGSTLNNTFYIYDYGVGNYADIVIIPEPATMLLLGLGGLLLRRRK